MRKWVSVAALVVSLASPTTALADSPPGVYSDFAEDGVLSCGHSRSALKGVLNDASIYQYGDPLTFLGLKLAIRRQLAGGCRRRSERSLSLFSVAGSGDSVPSAAESRVGSNKSRPGKPGSRPRKTQREPVAPPATAGVSTGGSRDGRMVVLGVVLLLLTLGSGGWAARRALTD